MHVSILTFNLVSVFEFRRSPFSCSKIPGRTSKLQGYLFHYSGFSIDSINQEFTVRDIIGICIVLYCISSDDTKQFTEEHSKQLREELLIFLLDLPAELLKIEGQRIIEDKNTLKEKITQILQNLEWISSLRNECVEYRWIHWASFW